VRINGAKKPKAGSGPDTDGPSALHRLGADVLAQAGVTDVLWLEGINDIGLSPNATAAQIIKGYKHGLARMRKAHLNVLLGTLTPAGGATPESYGGAAANKVREEVNAWIRTQPSFIDFDAAVRDPGEPGRINPAYDGGDHLHFNLAGYRAMANAVPLGLLKTPICEP
jgi:lysophospholipase L1-like esterase